MLLERGGFESMNRVSAALMVWHSINSEFKIQRNTKVNLGIVPQKEENTIFLGERISKGIGICSGVGVCVESMSKMEMELSSPVTSWRILAKMSMLESSLLKVCPA